MVAPLRAMMPATAAREMLRRKEIGEIRSGLRGLAFAAAIAGLGIMGGSGLRIAYL